MEGWTPRSVKAQDSVLFYFSAFSFWPGSCCAGTFSFSRASACLEKTYRCCAFGFRPRLPDQLERRPPSLMFPRCCSSRQPALRTRPILCPRMFATRWLRPRSAAPAYDRNGTWSALRRFQPSESPAVGPSLLLLRALQAHVFRVAVGLAGFPSCPVFSLHSVNPHDRLPTSRFACDPRALQLPHRFCDTRF